MKVFVAGATGVIGRSLLPRLCDAGHEVIGMTRSAERADQVRALGARAVVGDALDADGLRTVVCDVGPSPTEPEHEHADLRYVFATGEPGAIAPEGAGAPLRWLTVEEARVFTGGGNLVATLDRIEPLLAKR